MEHLISVNVGIPKDISWHSKVVHTSVWKTPILGPRMVRKLNIDGDAQGDLAGHGGEHRAVLVYQIEAYRYWEKHFGSGPFEYGQFGENFTVAGLSDADVCIGDRYRIGTALFEVTQPRVTCYRLGIRMNEPEMAALLVSHGRPGFYLRVVEEGQVQAGDEIVLVTSGPERMSVREIDALLYLPGHSGSGLERALKIPALSLGWRKSFQAMLANAVQGGGMVGNAGLGAKPVTTPAWRGFRSFCVTNKVHESGNVVSITLEPLDQPPVPAALPGQYIVLRLGAALDLTRSYSLSGAPDKASYRISVKREAHGKASSYINETLDIGDTVDASAARGNFTLRSGDAPVVLLSAGIGVTPVLAMLHALAAETVVRDVWWLHGTRNGREHPFAEETRSLVRTLVRGHSHVFYSSPDPDDRPQVNFDARGHLDTEALRKLNVPTDADFYICGPAAFMSDLTNGLTSLGVKKDQIHTETFGAGPSLTPGIVAPPHRAPHTPQGPAGTGTLVSFTRSGLNVPWDAKFNSLLEFAEACDVPVRWSCRVGVCHNCETGLVGGNVSYHPEPIDAPAAENILICCSRPAGDIMIDL